MTDHLPRPLPALSRDRLMVALDENEISYHRGTDGELTAGWTQGIIAFFLMGERGEVLQVRGYWMPDLTVAERQQAMEACNTFSIEQVFPKCYVSTGDDGLVQVMAEHSMDYEHGVSDEQLSLHVDIAIGTIMRFFDHLNTVFPEQWEKALAEL